MMDKFMESIGDTCTKGYAKTGERGIGTTIKGSYNTYQELIVAHPTCSLGNSYIMGGFLYVWNGNAWENVGNLKGNTGATVPKGDTDNTGSTGAKGYSGATSPK